MAHSILPHVVVPAPPDIIVGFDSGGSGGGQARRWAIAPGWARARGGSAAQQAAVGDGFISVGIGLGPPGTLSRTVFDRPWWHSVFGSDASD